MEVEELLHGEDEIRWQSQSDQEAGILITVNSSVTGALFVLVSAPAPWSNPQVRAPAGYTSVIDSSVSFLLPLIFPFLSDSLVTYLSSDQVHASPSDTHIFGRLH